jgi:autotransporter adhesin
MGSSAQATGANAVAMGSNAQATGTGSIAIGDGAVATGSIAVGVGAQAANGGAAFGDAAQATGSNATAVGTGAQATFANSAAVGSGAVATRANQQVYGTAANTYTMAGVTSAASRAAQSGPLQIVTSDAGGNLATATAAGLGLASAADIAGLSSQIAGLDAQVAGINSRLNELDGRSSRALTGVAMAVAMAGVPTRMPGERFAVTGNWGGFQGHNGLAFNAALRLADNVQLNGGIGLGLNDNLFGGRVGLRIGW